MIVLINSLLQKRLWIRDEYKVNNFSQRVVKIKVKKKVKQWKKVQKLIIIYVGKSPVNN